MMFGQSLLGDPLIHFDQMIEAKPPAGEDWGVIRTRPRQEKALAEALAAAGVRHYLPLVSQTKQYGHRRRVTQIPLFAGYLFFRGPETQTHFAGARRRIAGFIPVPDQHQLRVDLVRLRLLLRGGGDVGVGPCLERGMKVRISGGPLKGLEGLVEDIRRPDRFVLHVHSLACAANVEIESGLLEAVE